ncbi:MAG: hypothetical protein M1838_001559 [Thelocarpon superellum]|nr:MAG: hypothetical protein M1838_001559 [Thelocarpon superellum]
MSLGVALQSVLYYVVACSACHKSAHRRRRKREAVLAKAEKGELETEQPGLYRHPSPFSTNVYWREEQALGPGPPQRRAGKNERGSQHQLLSVGPGSSVGSSGGCSPGPGKDSTELHPAAEDTLHGDNWNRRRYQREDEDLWGHGVPPIPHRDRRGSNVGSSIGLVGIGRPEKAATEDYYTARNPPVNELHPPIVSTHPTNRSETRWMLQPPPSAKIMEGKERATLSRSDSGASKKGPDPALSRQIGERLMEEKRLAARRSHLDEASRSRASSKGKRGNAGTATPDGQRHDRDTRGSLETNASKRERRSRRHLRTSTSEDSIGPLDTSADHEPPADPGQARRSVQSPTKLVPPSLRASLQKSRTSSPHPPVLATISANTAASTNQLTVHRPDAFLNRRITATTPLLQEKGKGDIFDWNDPPSPFTSRSLLVQPKRHSMDL